MTDFLFLNFRRLFQNPSKNHQKGRLLSMEIKLVMKIKFTVSV